MSEPGTRVVRLSDGAEIAPEHYFIAPEKLLDGNPQQTVWLEYQDGSAQFVAGLWASEAGAWRVHYTEEEYCRIVEGVSIITDSAGHAVTVRAGDEFVIPAGFVGSWRVLEATRKRFVIYERTAAPVA